MGARRPRAALLALAGAIAAACGGGGGARGGRGSIDCGGYLALTAPIRGPAVGEAGNDADNPFRALAIHPSDPDTVYVGSEGNGLFKSTDGGTSWTWLRAGLLHCDAYAEVYSIAIDPSNPDRVFIAMNAGPGSVTTGITATGGVYRSFDAGTTWERVDSGLTTGDANAVAVFSPGGPRVLIGLGGGQSTNAGDESFYPGGLFHGGVTATTWEAASAIGDASSSRFWQIRVRAGGVVTFGGNPITGSGAGIGILASPDGIHWSPVADPLPGLQGNHLEASEDLQTLYVDLASEASPPSVYKSLDGGAHWTNPPLSTQGPIRIVGEDPATVLVGSSHRILRSTDGLESSAVVLTAPSSSNEIMAIETAPSDPAVVYATAKGLLVYRSTDGGRTFDLRANLREYIDAH